MQSGNRTRGEIASVKFSDKDVCDSSTVESGYWEVCSTSNVCIACECTHYLDVGQCYECSSVMPGCDECSSDTICTTCYYGFILNSVPDPDECDCVTGTIVSGYSD